MKGLLLVALWFGVLIAIIVGLFLLAIVICKLFFGHMDEYYYNEVETPLSDKETEQLSLFDKGEDNENENK